MGHQLLFLLALTLPPAAKVLAVSAGVYATLQIIKQAPVVQPWLKGWIAVVFNIVFSIIGAYIAVPADQFYSLQTWLAILTAALGAAGIHGTVQNIVTSSPPPPK